MSHRCDIFTRIMTGCITDIGNSYVNNMADVSVLIDVKMQEILILFSCIATSIRTLTSAMLLTYKLPISVMHPVIIRVKMYHW